MARSGDADADGGGDADTDGGRDSDADADGNDVGNSHDGVGANRGHSHQVARGENQKHSLLVLSFKSLKPYRLPLLSVQKEEFV